MVNETTQQTKLRGNKTLEILAIKDNRIFQFSFKMKIKKPTGLNRLLLMRFIK